MNDGEVPTWDNLSYPVLDKYLEKDLPVLEKSSQTYPCTRSLFFSNMTEYMINLTCFRKS